jgi:hypothetical protein
VADLPLTGISVARVPAPTYLPAELFSDEPVLIAYTTVVRDYVHRISSDSGLRTGYMEWASRYIGEGGTTGTDLAFLPDKEQYDVARLALERLGPSPVPQPLYLVRSDPDPDPFLASLPRLTSGRDWIHDELTLSHLGGSAGVGAFDFLRWSLTDAGATVLFVDQPPLCLAGSEPAAIQAVALRCGASPGPASILAHGERTPPNAADVAADRVFAGSGPCAAWLEFAQAAADGTLRAEDRVLLRCGGLDGEGWLLLQVHNPGAFAPRHEAAVIPAGLEPDAPVPSGS